MPVKEAAYDITGEADKDKSSSLSTLEHVAKHVAAVVDDISPGEAIDGEMQTAELLCYHTTGGHKCGE